MIQKPCPYPGLRPFTEDESIFFKGRDAHIRQIIRQLEENKIVVITGASGDGKSSLVYAGIIPNARAGFFRAKHNNWLVADFRPERIPLTNLATSVAKQLKLDKEYAYEELSHGFSALVDLYKESSFFLDKATEEWEKTSDTEKKEKKSNAGNLLILADQFEEFFTNNENYSQGTPSNEAYTTVNVLLETAQIALREDLPIYVVFTMRSDFISQCVAFKGLPETIGFSQFFIPRLKRNELQQVIEEPALLAGGTMSKRLTELLINELREGFDRLPVLQHALNRLWKIADNGNDQLDLIHLAKLAGLSTEVLPASDQEIFKTWFVTLSAERKQYYQSPELDNLLNTHANTLYNAAHVYTQNEATWLERKPSLDEVKLILKIAFQSLIKNDNGRSVRNRMNLLEITQIINVSSITHDIVCATLNVFRLPESTFIRPFIEVNDLDTKYLAANTVLDITHEALIRNWQLLQEWELQERANQYDFQDFSTQLSRWLTNEKNDSYLLSSGSLAHFEDWYARCQPNLYWIAKLDDSSNDRETKLERAAITASEAVLFLETSKKVIAITEWRKKRQRMFAFGSFTVIILILAIFSFWALREKANADTQRHLAQTEREEADSQRKAADVEKNRAVTANKKAEAERAKALTSEQKAIQAKELSEQARMEAERQRQIAQEQSQIAQSETEKALTEKQRASSAQQVAEKQRKRAVAASDSAQQLSILFIAQALAYKATNDYNDPQLNLLLAKQAYNFHTQYNGKPNSPAISLGMLNALFFNNYENNFSIQGTNPISFDITDSGFAFVDQANTYTLYSPKLEVNKQFKLKVKNRINRSFSFPDFSIFCLENYDVIKVSNSGTQEKISRENDLLRVAALAPNKELYLLGLKNGVLKLNQLNTNKTRFEQNIPSRPTAVVFSTDSKSVYISTATGQVYIWKTETNELEEVISKFIRISALALLDESQLLVGLANGKLLLHDIFTGKEKVVVNSQSAVQQISTHPLGVYFATVSLAGEIKVYNKMQLNEPPQTIFDHQSKVKQIKFEHDKIWALTNKNKLYFWETDYRKYEQEIKARLTRNFTPQEWDAYVGKSIPYETTL